MNGQCVVVLDFGGLYKGLIASIVRTLGVRAQILPCAVSIDRINELSPQGIILTGGPHSAYADDAPKAPDGLFDLGIPVLGICYGMQIMAHTLGGKVEPSEIKECGGIVTHIDDKDNPLFFNIDSETIMLMSHSDRVTTLPQGFRRIAHTKDCEIASMCDTKRRLFGVQFHPEVETSRQGAQLIRNFVLGICGAKADYSFDDFADEQIRAIRDVVKDGHVVLGLSGGLDSCVCAKLLEKAIPNQLTCVYVDNGLMRYGESEEVEKLFKENGLNYIRVNAKDRFLLKLKGVTDPEQKRKIVGEEFVRIFEEEGRKYKKCYFAQGTVQADVVESGTENCAVIKSHHNVGGLPEYTDFAGIIEPLRSLFKNEVRDLGRRLGLSEDLLCRPPFPGPGLAIRIIGEVTEEKLTILRHADRIYREEIEKSGVDADQYFAVLTGMRTVGIMGDDRAYSHVIALRAIKTRDYMTGEYVRLPYDLIDRVSARIIGEVGGVIRVVYDVTSKPPATIEWE